MSTDLAAFLLARIAEDERMLRVTQSYVISPVEVVVDIGGVRTEVLTPWSAERLLVECEAKRRIVQQLNTLQTIAAEIPSGSGRLAAGHALEVSLRLLALPHADHPDYRQEWRP